MSGLCRDCDDGAGWFGQGFGELASADAELASWRVGGIQGVG
jgi:hypothetical protein